MDQFNASIQRVYIWTATIQMMWWNNDAQWEMHLAPAPMPTPTSMAQFSPPTCNEDGGINKIRKEITEIP